MIIIRPIIINSVEIRVKHAYNITGTHLQS